MYGLTHREQFLQKKQDTNLNERLVQLVLVLAMLFVIAFALDTCTNLTQVAHAQEPVQAYTLKDYCNLIAQTGEPVANATHAELQKACPNLWK